MVPGREALAKSPAWGWAGGPQRLPSQDSDGAAICPARSLPLPTPGSFQDSLSYQLKPSFHFQIYSLATASPAPPGKGGRTLHPNLELEQGKRGPNLALKRAGLAPLSPSREGCGASPFRN